MQKFNRSKILGASVANIISILSKDFVLLVMIAFAIALPIAWWATYKWLADFAYRKTMDWWVYCPMNRAHSRTGALLSAC